MRIVTCPKCSGTQLNSEMKMGEPVMFQCIECGYCAERKEFKIEDVKTFKNFESSKWVTGDKI